MDKLIDKILNSDYGDIITHKEIGEIIEEEPGTQFYYFKISKANKKLLNKSKMLQNINRVGYKIVEPGEYCDVAVKTLIKGRDKMLHSKKIMEKAPTNKMTSLEIKRHNETYDRLSTFVANVKAGVNSVKKVSKKKEFKVTAQHERV